MGTELRIGLTILLMCAVLLLGGEGGVSAETEAPLLHRAGLIVQFPDGSVSTWCVEFPEDSISGMELLRLAGLEATVDYAKGMGGAVCNINGLGCDYPAVDCFCQCVGSDCHYWSYWRVEEGNWRYSVLGAGLRKVRDGNVEGWAWGDEKSPPPFIPFEQICSAPPTVVPEPTRTPTAIATQTAMPPDTALPTSTSSPIPAEAATATVTTVSGWTETPARASKPTAILPATPVLTDAPSPIPAEAATATVTAVSDLTATPVKSVLPTNTSSPTPFVEATSTAAATPASEETGARVGQAILFFVMAAVPLSVLILVARRRR